MKPIVARVLMITIVSAVAISGIVLVNSRFAGSFAVGLALVVAPVLALSFLLPRVLPVRCSACGGRVRFCYGKGRHAQDVYAYVCEGCQHRHEWEGGSSPSSLDN